MVNVSFLTQITFSEHTQCNYYNTQYKNLMCLKIHVVHIYADASTHTRIHTRRHTMHNESKMW